MLDFFKRNTKSPSATPARPGGFGQNGFGQNSFSQNALGQKLSDESKKKGKYDWKDAPLSVTEVIGTCLDVAFSSAAGGHDSGFAGLSNQVLQGAQGGNKAKAAAKMTVPPNPLFVSYGHSTGDLTIESPATLKYLQRRKYKEVGSTSIGITGAVATIASLGHLPVNPISIAKQASTTASTAAHLTKLKLLAREIDAATPVPPEVGRPIEELLREVIKVKVHKSGIEGTKLVTGSIPVLGQIATAGVNAGINAATSAAKTFDKAFHARHCAALALEIHWMAYQEQFRAYCRTHRTQGDFFARNDYLAHPRPPRLTGMNLKTANETLRKQDRPPRLTGMGLRAAREALEAHAPPASRKPSADFDATVRKARQNFYFYRDAGPATKLFTELFTRRSALAVLGGYDIAALIMEPGGWVALTDKVSSL